jgi:hypothetical protein
MHVGRGGIFFHISRCEVFMVEKIQVKVLWVVTPCGVEEGYKHF